MMLGMYFELLAAMAMLACCLGAAYAMAVRICPAAPVSVRCCAVVLAAAWLQAALFEVLISLHAFRLAVAVPAWLFVAVLLHASLPGGRALRRQARADWQSLRDAAGEIWTGKTRVALLLVAGVSAAHLLHGLIAPPLTWDGLTYQLVRPAVWVQTGAMVVQPAPDAWSYYAYFPYTGNIPWAWAMLPVRGELLLAPMEFAIWLSLQLAAYTAARLLGARRHTAVLAALTIGTTPAVFAYLTSAYVDNTLLAGFLLGTVFLIRTFSGHRREAMPALAAFGLTAGVKLPGAVILGMASAALVVYLFWPSGGRGRAQGNGVATKWKCRTGRQSVPRRFAGLKRWSGAMAFGFAAVVVGIMPYLRNWINVGSPLYPKALRLLGFDVFAGNEQFAAVLDGSIFGSPQSIPQSVFLRVTFMPGWQFTGLGPVAPIMICLGVLGLIVLLRRKALWMPLALMLICSALLVTMLYLPDTRGVRAHWPGTCGRFLMPAMACCVLGATAFPRISRWVFYAAIGFGVLWGVPRGWSAVDAKAVGTAAMCLAVAGCVAWLFRSVAARVGYPRLGTAAALLVAGMVLMPLVTARRHSRYAIYRAAEARRSWVTCRLSSSYASAWPIWRYFDTMPGRRIAVTAGFEDAGHNWYRYPLLGSRLQNRLLYVPITTDGRIVNYRNLDHRDCDSVRRIGNPSYTAWVRRLIDQRVEYVVSLAPASTLESQWMARLPELFEPVVTSADGRSRAYRFRPPEAVRVAQGRRAIPLRRN